jgi:shikimate dehydrogenase
VKEYPGRLVLLGHPLTQTVSPVFQNAALRAAHIPLVYEALDTTPPDLPQVLATLKKRNAAGNVTIPHKVAVHAACDDLTDIARRVGAVNTFWCEAGTLWGDNTDVGGFDAAARRLLGGAIPGARVALLGAGGSAAAVLGALTEWPDAKVKIVARNTERSAELARRFPDVARVERQADAAVRDATLIVNATPVGQQDDDFPLDLASVSSDTAILDLVYKKGGTAWVKAARKRGLRASDGLPMLLEQGALAFQRWFGKAPDREAMRLSVM